MGAPGVGAHHLERAEGPGAWHGEFEVAELGQQVAAIAAIASVSFAELGHALEVLIDQLAPPTFQRLGARLPGTGAIILAPVHALRLHGLQHLKGNR